MAFSSIPTTLYFPWLKPVSLYSSVGLWPKTRIIIRLIVLIALAIVPIHPLFLNANWWTPSVLLYALLSVSLEIYTIRTQRTAIYATTMLLGMDLAGFASILINDPDLSCPSLVLWVPLLGIQIWNQPDRAFRIGIPLAGTTLLLSLLTKSLLLNQHIDKNGFLLLCADCMATPVLWLFSLSLQQLRHAETRNSQPDTATGLYPPKALDEAARYFLPYQQRTLIPIILMCLELQPDPKNPKDFIELTKALTQRIRASDVAVRYDLHTVAVLLLDCPSADAERIAHEIFQVVINDTSISSAQLQIGLAPVPPHPVALDRIMLTIRHTLQRTRSNPKAVRNIVHVDPDQHTRLHL